MFNFELREAEQVVIADLAGRLTYGGEGAKALHMLVDELLASGKRDIVLNLAAMEYLDSFGLGELISAFRTTTGLHGRLKILNPRGKVYDTLSLARLLPLFEVFDSEADCLASFQGVSRESEREVLYELRERVAIITLNRPRHSNSLGRRLLSGLVAVLEGIRGERKARSVVLTGAGKWFCSGAELDELREGAGALATLDVFQTVIREIASLPKPVVAAINGSVRGAGLDLALACDLRVLSSRAQLAAGSLRLGLVPDGGSTQLLPRLLGPARAAEMILAGRHLDAERALAWGLVNEVVADDELLDRAVEWAAEIGRGPTRAMGRAKHLLRTSPVLDLGEALDSESREQKACFEDPDFHEGLKAAQQKRAPNFPE